MKVHTEAPMARRDDRNVSRIVSGTNSPRHSLPPRARQQLGATF